MTAIRNIRQWHSYIGLFVAPSVLFFTLTGALQLFSLHESHGSYKPPVIIEKLSSVHKDQVFALGDHHPAAAVDAQAVKPAAVAGAAEEDEDKTDSSTLVLKGFFLLVALALAVSTCFGVWMGLTQTRNKRTSMILLAAGVLIPLLLLVL